MNNCKHLYGTHGHGTPWCIKHKAEANCDGCKDHETHVHIGPLTNLSQERGPKFTPHYDSGLSPQQDRCHRIGDKTFETVVPCDKDERMKQLFIMYGGNEKNWVGVDSASGRRTERLRRWFDGCWPDELNTKLQEAAARMDFEKIERRLLTKVGITKIHDEYVIDKKFISPFKVGEVVTFKGAAHVIREICGPILALQPLTGDNIAVFEWEVEKQGIWAWITRLWRNFRRT